MVSPDGVHVQLRGGARIFRYEVPVDDQVHGHAIVGAPLFVAARRIHVVEFWAVADPSWASGHTPPDRERQFLVVGTGHQIEAPAIYRGSAIEPGGRLVRHLLEVGRS